MALRNVGLKPGIKGYGEVLASDEVNLQIMPPPDMPPALAAKKIDAFIVAELFNAAGEQLGEERCCVSPGISGATTHAVSFV